MAFPQGEIFYPGVQKVISADVVRGHGISPSNFTLTIAPQQFLPSRTGAIVLRYGTKVVNLPGCMIAQNSWKYDQNGYIWQFTVLDRRWRWRYLEKDAKGFGRTVNGKFNTRLPHGPVERMDPATKKSNKDIVALCLKTMGEKGYIIENMPDRYDELYFDHASPADALQQVCDLAGMRVILQFNNRIRIAAVGSGSLRLPNGPVIFQNDSSFPQERPDELHLVCGPNRYQMDIYCEPVGDDVDGLVKPIDDLSYKPVLGWKYGDLIHFLDVPLFNGSIGDWRNYVRPRELARASVYRKYRIGGTQNSNLVNKSFSIPGYPDKTKIRTTREILPIGQQLIEPTFDDKLGWFRPIENIVWGIFAYTQSNNTTEDVATGPDGESLPLWTFKPAMVIRERSPITGQELPSKSTTVAPPEEYDIDTDTGIITFRDVKYRYSNLLGVVTDRQHLPAVVWLRCGVCVNDPDTRVPIRHVEKYVMPNNDKTGVIKEIHDDSLFVRYLPTYSPGRPDSITGFTSNIDIVKGIAQDRLRAEARKFQTRGPQLRTYATWDNFEMDGSIHQICYHLASDGKATMTVCLNDEMTILTMPYNERRFYEKIRYEEVERDALLKYIRENNLPFSKLSGLASTGR